MAVLLIQSSTISTQGTLGLLNQQLFGDLNWSIISLSANTHLSHRFPLGQDSQPKMRSNLLLTLLSANLATSSSPFYTEPQYPFIETEDIPNPSTGPGPGSGANHAASSFKCDLPPPVTPSDGLPSARDLFASKGAVQKQVERHAALVRVPSICYDDLGDFDKDERWNVFYELHDVLKKTYPVL